MKRSILLLAVLVSFLSSAIADNILLLTNTKTGETNVFRKGSFMVFELKKDNTVREGYIREIQDSSLSFEDLLFEGQVSLSEINFLAGSTKSRLAARRVVNAVGTTLLFAGTTVFDCGTGIIMGSDYYYWPLGGTVWLAGAFIAGLGHAIDWASCSPYHAVRVRNYRQWNASIIQEEQPQITEKQNTQPSDTIRTSPAQAEPAKEKKKKSKITEDDVYGE